MKNLVQPNPLLLEILDAKENFVVSGHSEPDGDCIFSALAFASFLRRQGKNVNLCSAGPFTRGDINDYEPLFLKEIPPIDDAKTALIIVDCSTFERTGLDFSKVASSVPVLVVDHHSSGLAFGTSCFINPDSPSASLLVQQVIESMCSEVSKEEATYIFKGFATDSGFFRFLTEVHAPFFELIGRLVDKGVSPNAIYQELTPTHSLENRKRLGRFLLKTRAFFGGKALLCCESLREKQKFQTSDWDSDSLYQLLESVEGVQVVVSLREKEENFCVAGLRSKGNVDVGKVAFAFGGGGHKKAAGFSYKGSLASIEAKIIESLGSYFS